ncbi:MAG: hypothetical protein WB785_07505 [Mycobacterium sp.]|uniref:hypothetical protein n=1 Tax=Mycobacterium sp. TaxID=1785 RepID=UPI003C47B954
MLWVALVCAIVGAVLLVAGLALYANGAGVAPAHRTADDPTGFKRATSRVEWGDRFRGMPRIVGVMRNQQAERSDRLMALGSLCVLVSLIAWFVAVLAFITALVPA